MRRRSPGVSDELELTDLDLGEVQHVVEQRHQRAARGDDGVDHLRLARAEFGRAQRLRHAEHAVQGRADLVAHVREERGTAVSEAMAALRSASAFAVSIASWMRSSEEMPCEARSPNTFEAAHIAGLELADFCSQQHGDVGLLAGHGRARERRRDSRASLPTYPMRTRAGGGDPAVRWLFPPSPIAAAGQHQAARR